ncbi:MAG: HxlR family transcriptional regulator [Flavobacteriaceae bacterium]|nr:HxlR family transcriptional regulator [Flavobacteriaceae bacterium]
MNYIIEPTYRSGCSVSTSLDLLGDKWSLLIIRDIFIHRNTFSQFLKDSPEGIATNILTDRLKKLRAFGVIDFIQKSADKKIKSFYLTQKGIDLFPVLHSFHNWSTKHVEFEKHEAVKKKLKANKGKTDAEIIESAQEEYMSYRKEEFGF